MLFRRKLTVVGIAVLALFVVRPQAGYLRGRVSQTLRRALGREVEIRSVHLRFLPRPGFILDNVVIADDSAFGAEPLVRAPEVTAWLRLIPLLRGRIEISTLNLADASLNVTSDEQGKWNVEELIDRTARVSTAPTSARGRQARSKFPYIEATQARINLKVGREKTHFAFTNADFALWQETENAWALRLRARPIRTDANLTDTGTVLLSGLWQRSSVLSQTPLQFSMTWNQAQIGQLSKLIHGADRGWRGSAALSATVSGTPENLRLVLDASVEDFRRHDVLGVRDLRLAAHCAANYSSAAKSLSNIECDAPDGYGAMELKGGASLGPSSPWVFSSYDLRVIARKVPAESVLMLARHLDPNISSAVEVNGTIEANLEISRSGSRGRPLWRGHGTIQEFKVSSSRSTSLLLLGTVPFTIDSAQPPALKSMKKTIAPAWSRTLAEKYPAIGSDPQVEIGPINIGLGSQVPIEARALYSPAACNSTANGVRQVRMAMISAESDATTITSCSA